MDDFIEQQIDATVYLLRVHVINFTEFEEEGLKKYLNRFAQAVYGHAKQEVQADTSACQLKRIADMLESITRS